MAAITLGAGIARAQTTYTWNVSGTGLWTTGSSWTPTRNSPASNDILVINGSTTPTPTLTNVPTQTIGRLRVINNANATLTTTTSAKTVTIGSATPPSLEILAGSTLTLSGSTAIVLSIASGANASISGNMTITGGAHQLLGTTANQIVFNSGAVFTSGASTTSNPFGNSGTANVVTFASGATYTHAAGLDPFGLAAPSAKIVFQTGSTAIFRTNSGYNASGRTYSNLTVQNSAALSASGSGNFAFRTLNVESGSSFTHTGSSTATVTITGDITTAGSGSVAITGGSGLIQLNSGALQTIGGGGGTGTITFTGGAVTALGTTVAVSRNLVMSSGAMTVNGTFQVNQGGGATGTSFVYGAGGTLIFNTTSSFSVGSTTFWPTSNGPPNVNVLGAGGITLTATRTVSGLFQTSATVTRGDRLTLNGTTQRNPGGSFADTPVYGPASTLVYNGAFTVGPEWTTGTIVGTGVPLNVTIQAGAGTVTESATNHTVPGNLLISSGTFALSASTGNLFVGGNWTDNGTFTANGRIVTFNGTGTQTIARTGGETFAFLAVNKTAGNLVFSSSPATNVTVTGATGDVLQLINAGSIDLGGNTLTLSGNGGNLLVGTNVAPTTRTITGTGTVAFAGGKIVTNNNSKTLVLDTNVRSVLTVAGTNFGAGGLTTVRGVLELGAGGSVVTPPIYASGAILRYKTGATIGRGGEWSATSGAGFPYHVEVQGNTTVDLGNGGAAVARQIAGNLTIDPGSSLTMNNAGNLMTASLTVLGNVNVNGTLTLSTLAGGDLVTNGSLAVTGTLGTNGRSVTFAGANAQTITRAGGITLDYLKLNKSGGSVQLLNGLTVNAPAGGNALELNGTVDVLDLNGNTMTLTSTVGGTDAAGSLKGSATSNLVLNGTGAMGTIRFQSGSQTLGNFTVNRTSSGTVTLGSPLTVAGALALTNGTVVTGTNALTVGAAGAVARTNGWVVGLLAKNIAAGPTSATFEIGAAAGYTPVTVSFASVTTGGLLTASTTSGDHPSLSGSGIITTKSVNRYFTLTNSGIVFTTYGVTLNFLAADVDAGSNTANFDVRKFDSPTWTVPPTLGTVTATSIQASGMTSFSDFAIGETVRWTITSSTGPNGTVSPLGAVLVKDRRNQTFTFQPSLGYQVQNVLVDGVSVGAPSSYTFTSVTANHTISVTYTVAMYTLSVGVSGAGSVTVVPDQAQYAYHTYVNLYAVPEVGNEFVSWTGDAVWNDSYLQFAVDSNMTVLATFRRVPLSYTRSSFAGSYTPLSTATGATRLISIADDSTKSIPLPFTFVYTGLPYTPSNFLAVNANGFGFLSRTNVQSSIPTQANNVSLYGSSQPNNTLAPWYDDLSVGPVGTNPAGSVLYQTSGAPGSRVLTVQWTNVSSYQNATSGQPRQINFQLALFEGTNTIEYRYGPVTGSEYSIFESASIGLEDSTGGNSQYIDAVTGSRLTNNGMMTTNRWPQRFYRFVPGTPPPIPAGTYNVGVGQTYPSLTEAAADLNYRGIAGPVTLLLTDAVYDSSAAGGGNIFPIVFAKIAGVSPTNTITVLPAGGTPAIRSRGTENGICGNQSLASAISSTNEPIIALVGTDYFTLRGVSLDGGPTVDRGVLVIPSSPTDGAQNNLITNLSVSLTRANTSSIGIQQTTTGSPTDPSGTNSGNHYYNLQVTNCYAGVSLAGNATYFDANCEVGGGYSVIGGNVLGDIGNGTLQTFGVRAINQRDLKVFDTEVRNIQGTATGLVDGIVIDNSGASSVSSGVISVYNNSVHDLNNTSTSAGRVAGIRVNLTTDTLSSSRVYNNSVLYLNSSSTSTASRRIVGIMVQDAGGGAQAIHNIDFNSVRISPTNVTCPNSCFEMGTTTGAVMRIRNNIFGNYVGTQHGSGKHYCIVTPALNSVGPAGSRCDRNILFVNNISNGFIGLANSVDKLNLSDWQAVASTDSFSSSADPQYISDANLHINSSIPTPVESGGSYFGGAISWVPLDADAQVRNSTTPDIGADEGAFVVVATTDARAASLVDPQVGSMKLVNVSFSPQATFSNAGTANVSNISVRYRISGPSPSTTVIYDRTSNIASLGSGATTTITFPSFTIANAGFYTMRATATVSGDQNVANDEATGSFEIAGPMNGSYTVGVAQPAPFNTLTATLARVSSVGISGPVTLLLQDATYSTSETFPITVAPVPGASSSNDLTIRPAPGVNATITGSSTHATLVLNGADYITIDGSNQVGGTTRNLTVVNTNNGSSNAVVWGQTANPSDAVTNVAVRNVTLVGNDNTQTMFGVGFGALAIGLNSNGVGNHNNLIENCLIKRTQYGIYSAGASAANKNTGTVIRDNDMITAAPDNVGRGGIVVRFENGAQIVENQIGNLSTNAANALGIAVGLVDVGNGTFVADEVTNATVTRNLISGVASSSIDGLSASGIAVASASSGTNNIVNNMISGVLSNALDPDLTVGILIGGGTGSVTNVYFNSVSMTGNRGTASASSFALVVGGTNPAVDVRNNVLTNTQTAAGPGESYAVGLSYAPPYSNLTSNYNDLYTGGPQLAIIGGLDNSPTGDRNTLAEWRTETLKDANSVSANPLFVSTSDLHITQSGSPVANHGTVIPSVTVDFDNDAGNRATTPDMGADEFGTYAINVTVAGSGTVTKTPDQPNYIQNTPVTLSATPAANHHFVGWSGDTTSSSPTLNFTMRRDLNLTATFAINTFTVDVTTTGLGAGSVSRNPNQASYAYGTSLQLTAVPGVGSHFDQWTGDTATATNPISLVVTSNRSFTAGFSINTYALNVNAVGNGAVAKNPDQALYNHGTAVQVTATPAAGYHLVGWSGSASGAANPLPVTMDTTKNITGTFAINTYPVTVTVVGSGTVNKNPDQATYDHGSSLQLIAVPAVGWHFVGWSGDTSGSTSPISMIITAAKNITATFAINTYTLGVTSTGSGSVAKSPDQATYDHGTNVQLTATPAPGQTFLGWGGDASGNTNPLTVAMTSNKNITASFTNAFALTAIGGGTATANPNQTSFNPGATVTLTATPDAGRTFLGWAGDASGNTNPLVVTMNAPKSIIARFTATMTVAVTGNGSVARSPSQAEYDPDSSVVLTATPQSGWLFVNWTGDVNTSTNPVTVRMDRSKSVTANFSNNNFILAVATVGSGSVIKSPDQASYLGGTSITLTATPATGWHFVSWSGDTSTTVNPLTFVIRSNRNFTANFAINTYTLAVTSTGTGSVAKSPDQPTYNHGTVVNLTATPGPGQSLVSWGGSASGNTNPLPVTMDGNKTITATFTNPLNVTVTGNGSVAKSPDQTGYAPGTSVTLTATPAAGSRFLGWSGDTSGATNPLTLTVNATKNVTANFINAYTLPVAVTGTGSVVKSPDQPTYDPGTIVALTANPGTGYHFVNWTGDTTASANPLSVAMTRDRPMTANFVINTYPLTVNVTGSGTVDKNPSQASYDHGTNVVLTANPSVGYHFEGWSGDATGSTSPISVPMTGPKVVTATFAINTYTLTTNVVGPGTVTRSPNQALYDHGTTVSLTATPATGYHFVGWSGDVVGNTSPIPVLMDGNKSVTATFAIDTYTLDVTSVGSGSVTKSPNQAVYDYATPVTLNATAGPSYHFVGWSGDTTGTTNPLTVPVIRNKSITATFAINTYTLATSVLAGQGIIDRNPDLTDYPEGSTVDLTAIAATGYHFTSWGGDASGTDALAPVLMDRNKSANASFAINRHTVTVTVNGSGTVTRSPDQPLYDYGSQVTLTAVPAAGFHFAGWTGGLTGSTNPVNLLVNGDKTVQARFIPNAYTLNVSVTGGAGTIGRSPDLATYSPGQHVVITLTPGPGFQFADFTIPNLGVATFNPIEFDMDSNTTVIGRVVAGPRPVLSVTILGSGTVTKDPDSTSYSPGTLVQMTASSGPGYHFTGWTGQEVLSINPLAVFMDRDKHYNAIFETDRVALTVNVSGSGSVAKAPDQPDYLRGSTVQLTANPDPGFSFVTWAGDTSGSGNPINLLMDRPKTVTARFGYHLTVNTAGIGVVTQTPPNQQNFLPNATVTLTAVARPGQLFTGWTGSVASTNNPITVTMNGNKTITANFTPMTAVLTVVVEGNGAVTKTPDQPAYDFGASVGLAAVPASGWHFSHWAESAGDLPIDGGPGGTDCPSCVSGASNPIAIVMAADRSIIAVFEQNIPGLLAEAEGRGAVTGTLATESASGDTTVILEATADRGWMFTGWSGDASGATNPLTIRKAIQTRVVAHFVRAIPEVRLVRASLSKVLAIGEQAMLSWSIESGRTVTAVDVEISRNGLEGPFERLTRSAARNGSFAWTVSGPTCERAILRVTAVDSAGGTGADTLEAGIGPALTRPSAMAFSVSPITPNPTTSLARVEFFLPHDARVRVGILDVQGREVTRLADASFTGGRHELVWNGEARHGTAPAGVYFVRVQTDGQERVRRFMIAR
jgi:uncharacterized repeat protein (TIGR02543 family)